ncbi:MAG: CbiX/SirB N-terminal domain-containing protein [Desulfobacteraceae bacterium]
MKGLIIAAHGSRKSESNEEILQLTRKFSAISGEHFNLVECAFLQFTGPGLEETITGMAEKGVEKIVVFPYFLGSGSHVTKDIPEILSEMETRHPRIQITATRHLGAAEGVRELILEEVANQ